MSKPVSLHKSTTSWKRIRAMKDKDIDFSDSPEIPKEMFAKAIVRRGLEPVSHKVASGGKSPIDA